MITGHCLCRAMEFAYDGEPKWTLNCHCESCRRATSSPMATWISVPLSSFRFTGGRPNYYASSQGVRRGFCAKCGSPLTYENERIPGEIHILAVALSDAGKVANWASPPPRETGRPPGDFPPLPAPMRASGRLRPPPHVFWEDLRQWSEAPNGPLC